MIHSKGNTGTEKKPTPAKYSIATLAEDLASEKLSLEQVVREELENSARYNKELNAFITLFQTDERIVSDSMQRAKEAFRNTRKKAERAKLAGIPFTIKDNVFVAGYKTTAACIAFKDFFPAVNADIYDSFLRAGAIPLGKTNLHELALGPTCSASYFGPVRNPVDSSRVTGGSSGGSAVSVVKAKYAIPTIGSDTGGSIRIPAALCGICGFKPTINTLSSFGVFPLSATLDTMGILAKTMEDLITTLDAIARAAFAPRSKAGKRKKKIGIPGKRYFDGADKEVLKNFWKAIDKIREDFEIVEGIVIPEEENVSRVRRSIMLREGAWFYSGVIQNEKYRKHIDASVLAAFDAGAKMGDLEGMRSELARVNYLGKMFSVFKGVDFVATPAVHLVAPKLDDMLDVQKYAVARALLIRNPEIWNLCGFPALSLPTHRLDGSSLPTGIQIAGEFGNDVEVLDTGRHIWNRLHS